MTAVRILVLWVGFILLGTAGHSQVVFSGLVIEKHTDSGIGKARVTVAGVGSIQTDDDGRFAMNLPQKKKDDIITVLVEAKDYKTVNKTITLGALALDPFKMVRIGNSATANGSPSLSNHSGNISTVAYYSRALLTGDQHQKLNACQVLGALGPAGRGALTSLIKAVLDDSDRMVRVAAIDAIVDIGIPTSDVREALRIALKTGIPAVQMTALNALADFHINGPDIVSDLEFAIKDPNLRVAIKAGGLLITRKKEDYPALIPDLKEAVRYPDEGTLNTLYSILLVSDSLVFRLADDLLEVSHGVFRLTTEQRSQDPELTSPENAAKEKLIQRKTLHFFFLLSRQRPSYVEYLLLTDELPTAELYREWPFGDTSGAYCILSIRTYSDSIGVDNDLMRLIAGHPVAATQPLWDAFTQGKVWAVEPLYFIGAADLEIFRTVMQDDIRFPAKYAAIGSIGHQHLTAAFVPDLLRIAFRVLSDPDYFYRPGASYLDISLSLRQLLADSSLHSTLSDSLEKLPPRALMGISKLINGMLEAGVEDSAIIRRLWDDLIWARYYCDSRSAASLFVRSSAYWPGLSSYVVEHYDSISSSHRLAFIDTLPSLHPDPALALPIIFASLRRHEFEFTTVDCLIQLAKADPRFQPALEKAIPLVKDEFEQHLLKDAMNEVSKSPPGP